MDFSMGAGFCSDQSAMMLSIAATAVRCGYGWDAHRVVEAWQRDKVTSAAQRTMGGRARMFIRGAWPRCAILASAARA